MNAGDFNLGNIDLEISAFVLNSKDAARHIALLNLAARSVEPESNQRWAYFTFTINPNILNRIEVIPSLSDQNAIIVDIAINPKINIKKHRKILQYRKADTTK